MVSKTKKNGSVPVTQDDEEVPTQEGEETGTWTHEHEPIIFEGELPAPHGNVPGIISDFSLADQRKHASELYAFFNDEDQPLLEMNADTTPRVAIVSIPQTAKVRVVYGMGFGSRGIGQTSAISGRFVMLHGDGGKDLGPPSVLVLPKEVVDTHKVHGMTHEQFSARLLEKGENFTYPLLARTKLTAKAEDILQLVPIPAYLVYDGFHKDLNAAEVYERLIAMDVTDELFYMHRHARRFLLSCLSGHNTADPKPYVHPPVMMAATPQIAKEWGRTRLIAMFPTLTAATPVHTAPAPSTPPTGDPNLARILEALIPHFNASRTTTTLAEEKKDTTAADIGMSKQELESTLAMCGLPTAASHSDLPAWFGQSSEKGW
jgi:hypothetical protein